MTTSFQEISLPIIVKMAGVGHPAAPLQIKCLPASEQPALGEAPENAGEVVISTGSNGKYSAVVSLGKQANVSPEVYRQAGGGLARWLIKASAATADLDFDPILTSGVLGAGQAFLEGLLLGAFQFNRYKKVQDDPKHVEILLISGRPETQDVIKKASLIAGAVNLARDWAHEPANIINPVTLAERISAMADQDHLKVTVIDEKGLESMQAGGILNVGKGSATPPRLIILEYPGSQPEKDARPVILIGKAITFDTGGYNLKSSESIKGMKGDKCGGVTVAAMLHLASQLKLRTPIIGIISAAENMISGDSYRPDDIIHMLSGKTVEIVSTDAEGRLVLADALTYAQNTFQPRAMIDLATLTGGVLVALGHVRAGLMSNSDPLASQLFNSGETVHERLWRLPLDDDFVTLIKGDDAELKNSGGREGHCILGGTFLKQFVSDDIPWAHLDIAGTAETNKDLPYCPKGATGFGIRLLTHYLESL